MRILGIETSCDETAVAIVDNNLHGQASICANVVWSQIEIHAPYGGVVPEIAARAHVSRLDQLIKQSLQEAQMALDDIDGFAATAGPGLIGGLIVGLMTGKSLAYACNKPFIAVNHLEGHALSVRLTESVEFPYLLLLVSGGHTQTIWVDSVGKYERLGTTIDDALGEAFDKTAKLLGLPYPGGPAVERCAQKGDPNRIRLPHPLRGEDRLDFSFSGLKTAVRQVVEAMAPLQEQDVADICASFQKTVAEILYERVAKSCEFVQKKYPNIKKPALVVAGGVAANAEIRKVLLQISADFDFDFVAPPPELCTDNAAMIAWVGAEYLTRGYRNDLSFAPRSRWPLDEQAEPKIGTGRRGVKA